MQREIVSVKRRIKPSPAAAAVKAGGTLFPAAAGGGSGGGGGGGSDSKSFAIGGAAFSTGITTATPAPVASPPPADRIAPFHGAKFLVADTLRPILLGIPALVNLVAQFMEPELSLVMGCDDQLMCFNLSAAVSRWTSNLTMNGVSGGAGEDEDDEEEEDDEEDEDNSGGGGGGGRDQQHQIHIVPYKTITTDGRLKCLRALPDGRVVSGGHGATINLWDPADLLALPPLVAVVNSSTPSASSGGSSSGGVATSPSPSPAAAVKVFPSQTIYLPAKTTPVSPSSLLPVVAAGLAFALTAAPTPADAADSTTDSKFTPFVFGDPSPKPVEPLQPLSPLPPAMTVPTTDPVKALFVIASPLHIPELNGAVLLGTAQSNTVRVVYVQPPPSHGTGTGTGGGSGGGSSDGLYHRLECRSAINPIPPNTH